MFEIYETSVETVSLFRIVDGSRSWCRPTNFWFRARRYAVYLNGNDLFVKLLGRQATILQPIGSKPIALPIELLPNDYHAMTLYHDIIKFYSIYHPNQWDERELVDDEGIQPNLFLGANEAYTRYTYRPCF